MLLDLASTIIGLILGGVIGFLACIALSVATKNEKLSCERIYEGCQNDCGNWPHCNEWEA